MKLKLALLFTLGALVTSCSTQGAASTSKSPAPVVSAKEQCLYAAITAFPKGDAEYSNVYESSLECVSASEVDKIEIRNLIAMSGLRAIKIWQETVGE